MPIFLSIAIVNRFIEPLQAFKLFLLSLKYISLVFESPEHVVVSETCLGSTVEAVPEHAPVVILLDYLRVIVGG